MTNIDIIGAGIGGLTTAIALEQKGIKTRLFEQAESLKPVGAGIILANNAMQVYERLGLRGIIEEHGNPISSMNITKADLSLLSKIDLSFFEQKYKVKNIAIHRGTLQQILVNKLKSTNINLNHRLTSLAENKDGYDLKFKHGEQVQSSVILGADGLHSIVRKNLFPNNVVRKANQICWRGVIDYTLPPNYRNELNEAWGKTDRFGFVQIAENKVYWYALKSFNKQPNEFSVDALEHYFSDYHSIIKDLIRSTKTEHINTAELSGLKSTKLWHNGTSCLIGDAAHAATPNLGQGACQAIEDAFVLSECLTKHDIKDAFELYQNLRMPKAHQVVKASWNIGKMAHIKNPLLIRLRNQMMKMTPTSINRKQSAQLFQLAGV